MDSAEVANSLKVLVAICKNADWVAGNTASPVNFSKAAPFIIYRGADKNRAWKVFADYDNAEDKKSVDEICNRINRSINLDSNYSIIKYFTEKESEGVWYVLVVKYTKNETAKKAAYAFLKLGKRFALGDIDLYYE